MVDMSRPYAARKYEMLQEFNKRRKKHWIAMLICAVLGGIGVHRIYLKQYKWAAIIFVAFVSIFILLELGPAVPGAYGIASLIVPIWYIIVLVEFFRLTNNADQANKGLRAELAKKYGIESHSIAKKFR